jgi:alpha-ketoglutarate-dependent taurine dioxygenase
MLFGTKWYNNTMSQINTIDFPGYEELKNNFNTYKDIFLNNQIIAFRNANLDLEDQIKVINLFGDNFNLQQNSSGYDSSEYVEDHHKHMNKENVENKNEIMLGWHQEHVDDNEDIYAIGVWCMEIFKCEPDAGKTYFMDMSKVYNSFTSIDKEFLDSCFVSIKNEWEIENGFTDSMDAVYRLVSNHWITNEKTIRTFYGRGEKVNLHSVNGNDPTELEIDKFNLLHDEIFTKVWLDNDVRIEHLWQEGDLLIPDLFKLAHAVTGGFDKDQRKLRGIFGTIGNYN